MLQGDSGDRCSRCSTSSSRRCSRSCCGARRRSASCSAPLNVLERVVALAAAAAAGRRAAADRRDRLRGLAAAFVALALAARAPGATRQRVSAALPVAAGALAASLADRALHPGLDPLDREDALGRGLARRGPDARAHRGPHPRAPAPAWSRPPAPCSQNGVWHYRPAQPPHARLRLAHSPLYRRLRTLRRRHVCRHRLRITCRGSTISRYRPSARVPAMNAPIAAIVTAPASASASNATTTKSPASIISNHAPNRRRERRWPRRPCASCAPVWPSRASPSACRWRRPARPSSAASGRPSRPSRPARRAATANWPTAIGSGPRAVGNACGANPYPVVVPCHRVVAASGGLGGFARQRGGFLLDVKRWLLAHEGS